MAWWRKALLWASRFLLRANVLLLVSAVVLASFFGNPDTIKQILNQSGAYDNVVDIILDETTKQVKDSDDDIPLNDQEIRELANRVFSPERLKEITETVSDSVFRWLDGKTDEPDFEINLTGEKTAIAEGIGDYVANRLKKLPDCVTIPSTNDPLKISCLPPGVEIKAESEKIKEQFVKNKDFLPDTIFTVEDLNKSNQSNSAESQTFNEQFRGFADAYRVLKMLPVLLLASSLLFATAVVFLDKTKRQGISRIGKILASNGLFLFITTLIFGKFLPITDSLRAKFKDGSGTDILNNILALSIDKIVYYMLVYSGIVLGLGVLILLALHFIKPKTNKKKRVL